MIIVELSVQRLVPILYFCKLYSMLGLSVNFLYFEYWFTADFAQIWGQIVASPRVCYLEDEAWVRQFFGFHLLSLPLFSVPEPLIELFLSITCFMNEVFEIAFVPVALVHVVVLNQNFDYLLALSSLWECSNLFG